MSAGALRERVTLLLPPPVEPDGRGGWQPAGPADELAVYARVRPLQQAEKYYLGQVNNPTTYEITLRHRPDVTPACRVRWQDQLLHVQGVRADERQSFLVLTCFNSGQ